MDGRLDVVEVLDHVFEAVWTAFSARTYSYEEMIHTIDRIFEDWSHLIIQEGEE